MPSIWLFLFVGLAFATQKPSTRTVPLSLRSLLALLLVFVFVWQAAASLSSYHTRQGVMALKKKAPPLANIHFDKAVQFPNADTALLKYCYSLGKVKRYTQAIKTCQSLLSRHPWHHIAHDQLARQFQSAGQLNMAREHYQKAIEIYPQFYRAKAELKRLPSP